METAETFRAMLLEIFACCATPDFSGAQPVQLDLSEVDVCGTAGIQLLLSAERTAAAKALTVQLIGASEAVEQAFARFGAAYPLTNRAQTGASLQ